MAERTPSSPELANMRYPRDNPPPDLAVSAAVSGRELPVIHALLCSTDYGILMSDLHGEDIVCNPRFGELFDIDPAVVVGAPRERVRQMALMRVKDPASFSQVVEAVYASPAMEHEDEIELQGAPPRILHRYTGPVLDAAGRNIGRIWTFKDVTQVRRLEENVRSYAARLEEQVNRQTEQLATTTAVLAAMTRITADIASYRDIEGLTVSIAGRVGQLFGAGSAVVLTNLPGAPRTGAICRNGGPPERIPAGSRGERALIEWMRAPCPPHPVVLRLTEAQRPLARLLGENAAAIAPLRWRDQTIGAVALGLPDTRCDLLTRYPDHMEAIVAQVSLALRIHQGRIDLQSAYEELAAAQERLVESAKIAAVGALSASVAHDIRNILTPLRLELGAAIDAPEVAAARNQVQRLSALTHRLLALATPDELAFHTASVRALLADALAIVRPQADIDGIRIQTRVGTDLPDVICDPNRVAHVLVNLFLNALAAMHAKGGTLGVAARVEDEGVRIEVKDTGVGIAPEHLPRIFDPFFTTRANGSGLGLFSAKRIIDEHGGRIAVRSVAGSGTRFVIWLPLRPQRLDGNRPSDGFPNPPDNKKG